MHSLPVHSNQEGPHPDLEDVVRRHLHSSFQRPLPAWVQQQAEELRAWAGNQPVILDSGCGTGLSSWQLATENPDCCVIGIDQSAQRLNRFSPPGNTARPTNLRLIRSDAQDLWRALARRGVSLHAHYLLYPNPWPKAHHLMRRWHGHPVWTDLLNLGGTLELRTNWGIYAEEFAQALRISGYENPEVDTLSTTHALAHPVSLFEKKYALSGHALWRVRQRVQALPPAP